MISRLYDAAPLIAKGGILVIIPPERKCFYAITEKKYLYI